MGEPNIIDAMPQALWSLCMDFWTRGYAEGIDHGRRLEHEEVAAIQRAAVASVHALSKLPPRDHAADQADAERRSRRWSA